MPHAQCPMPNAPCPMPHAQCPMPHAPCPECSNFRTKLLPYIRAEYAPLWDKIKINQGKNI
ncbi:MAG: hypothetical protein V7K95_22325 [Nostoc sp.]